MKQEADDWRMKVNEREKQLEQLHVELGAMRNEKRHLETKLQDTVLPMPMYGLIRCYDCRSRS